MERQPPVHPAEDGALLFNLSASIAVFLQFPEQFVQRCRE